jgi:hypothetical protein
MRAASVIGGPFNFYHIVSVGGAPNVFSSATLLGSFGTSGPYNHRYDGYAIAQLPSGGMRVFWPKASGSFVRGSPTLSYRDRDSGGVWSAEADWFSVSDGSALDAPMAVKNGLSSYRMAITNNSGDGTLNVPSGSNPGPGPGNKLYAFDDNKNKVIRIPASPRQYLSQTELALNRMTVAPSSARAALYDTLIRGLRSDGIADLLDALYLPKCHDRQAARINILRSGWDLTETNSGSITFVTDNYIAGNGTTSYLSMVLNPQFQQTPSLNLGGGSILRYNQNSASVFGVTGNLGDAGTAFGFGDATNFRIGVANINSTQLATRLNREAPTTTISLGTNGGIGFAGVTRKDINNISYNVNGTQATVAQAATGLTLTGFGFCGQGVGTSFSNRQVKAAGFGGGLTPAQLELLRIRINNFLSAF